MAVALAACGGAAPSGDNSNAAGAGDSSVETPALAFGAPTLEPSGADTGAPSPTPSETQSLPPDVERRIEALENRQQATAGERLVSSFGNAGGSGGSYTMHDFLVYVLQDADRFWSGVWARADLPAPRVVYTFPVPGATAPYACSKSGTTSDDTAAYCPVDDQIAVSQDWATRVWEGRVKVNDDPETGQASGDFSVAFFVAHEYAHSLQAELALIPRTEAAVLNRKYPVYKTELHADCWAGVWENSAYYEGILEAGDVEEGVQAANLGGDYAFEDVAGHHGTPAQRTQAFMDGYNSGVPSSCDRWLTAAY